MNNFRFFAVLLAVTVFSPLGLSQSATVKVDDFDFDHLSQGQDGGGVIIDPLGQPEAQAPVDPPKPAGTLERLVQQTSRPVADSVWQQPTIRKDRNVGHLGHKRLYQEIKSWNPASRSYVDQKDGDIKRKLAAAFVAGRQSKPASSGTTQHPGTEGNRAEGKNMNAWDPWTVVWITGLILIVGTIVWWWGALVFRRRGLWEENRAQSAAFDPHQRVCSVFYTRTTKDEAILKATPSEVAVAEAQTEATRVNAAAEIAHSRAMEAAARARERRDEIQAAMAFGAPLILAAPAGAGYLGGVREVSQAAVTPKKEEAKEPTLTIGQFERIMAATRSGGGQQQKKPGTAQAAT